MKTNKLTKSLFSLLMIFVLASLFLPKFNNVSAQVNPELRYSVLNDGVRIEGFKDEFYQGESVTIPSEIEGKKVTSINKKAFMGRKSLNKVVLPDTITTIGSNAFNDCSELKEINIPASVKTIGDFAFYMCKSLENFTVPNGVNEIKENTFAYCEKIKSISLPEGLKTINKNAFDFCTSLTEINIPSSVTLIDDQAFSNNQSLESIVIPDSVKNIGEMVFKDCGKLKQVTLSNNIPALKRGTFKHCSSLEKFKIPDSVKTIENGVFEGCSSIKTISFSKNVQTIASGCLVDCVKLEKIEVDIRNDKFHSKDGVLFNSVNKELIYYPAAKADKKYDIPDDVHGIDAYAFYNVKALSSIRIPKNVSYIARNAFEPVPDEIFIAADSPATKYAKKYFTKYTVYDNRTGETKNVNKNLLLYISIAVAVLLLVAFIIYKKVIVKKLKLKASVDKEQVSDKPQDKEIEQLPQQEAEVQQTVDIENKTEKVSE